jgi:hypothetical protein
VLAIASHALLLDPANTRDHDVAAALLALVNGASKPPVR